MAATAPSIVVVKGHSLRDRQIASIKRVLHLNETLDSKDENDNHPNGLAPAGPILTSEGEPIWKVLVFDDLGRSPIYTCIVYAPCMKPLSNSLNL